MTAKHQSYLQVLGTLSIVYLAPSLSDSDDLNGVVLETACLIIYS